MTDFILVTGFLGSGKTTLLKNILERYADDERIAIIQNEFAPAGTDGKELKLTGREFRLVELNNGSVFCACMLGSFIPAIHRILDEYNPSRIFLEASGLSDPIGISEILGTGEFRGKLQLAHIFAIVDPVNFERGMKLISRFKHQVMIADTIIVNKTDIFTGDPEILTQEIRNLNPFANLVHTSFCRFDLETYLSSPAMDHPAAERFRGWKSEGRPVLQTMVIRTNDRITYRNLKKLIEELKRSAVRIKGFINVSEGKTISVQTTFEQTEMAEVSSFTGPSELVVFSTSLNPGDLKNMFHTYSLKNAS